MERFQQLVDLCVARDSDGVMALLSTDGVPTWERCELWAFAAALGESGYTTANRALLGLARDRLTENQLENALHMVFLDAPFAPGESREERDARFFLEHDAAVAAAIMEAGATHAFVTGHGAIRIWNADGKPLSDRLGPSFDNTAYGGESGALGAFWWLALSRAIQKAPGPHRLVTGPCSQRPWLPLLGNSTTQCLFGGVEAPHVPMLIVSGLVPWHVLEEMMAATGLGNNRGTVFNIVGPCGHLASQDMEALRSARSATDTRTVLLDASRRVTRHWEEERLPDVRYVGRLETLLAGARADVAVARGDYAGAIQNFNWAIQIDPKDLDAWLGRALCLAYLGEAKESRELLDRVAPTFPNPVASARRLLRFAGLG